MNPDATSLSGVTGGRSSGDARSTHAAAATTERSAVLGPPAASDCVLLVSDGGRDRASIPLPAGLWTAGRSNRCELRLQDPTVSRRHCQLQVGSDAVWLTDLDSTNGTRVNGARIRSLCLTPGDVVHLGASSLTLVTRDSPQWRALDRLAEHNCSDGLTGLLDRRGFRRRVDVAFALGRSGARPGVLAIDADRLAAINARHGRDAGDRILRHIADQLRALLPDTGFAARVGGDEFALVLPQTTPAQARTLAHTLCRRVAARPVPWKDAIVSATISIALVRAGVDEGARAAFARADALLQRAKRAGGSRVCE